MLVLSRKKNESIIINDDITVTVIEIRGDKVRLGIEAPKDVSVHRREVYEAIHGSDPGSASNRERDPGPSPMTPDAGVSRNSNS
jgi:carbon storage regulator